MALTWIRNNISAFGGDPKRVTIMGESAGAKLLSAVLCAPKSAGLFQQYIAESGAVQCIRDTVTAKNERLQIFSGANAANDNINTLLSLPADSLIKLQAKVRAGVSGTSFFGPVIDGVVINSDPYQYAADHKLPKIKALMGTNETEGSLFTSIDPRYRHPDSLLLKEMFGDDYPMVYKSYQEWSKTLSPENAVVKTLTQYMYQMHTYRWAKALIQSGIPVWIYRFDYAKLPLGPAHASELPFVWYQSTAKMTDSLKKRLSVNMHFAWVSFITTGNPNIKSLPHWPNYDIDKKDIMIFNETSTVSSLTEVFDDQTFPSSVFVLKK